MKKTEKLTKIARDRIAEQIEAKRIRKCRNLDGKTKMERDLKTDKN